MDAVTNPSIYEYNLIDACINVFLESLERKFMLAIFIHGNLVWPYYLSAPEQWVCYPEGQHNGQMDWPFPHWWECDLTPWEDLELVTPVHIPIAN